MPRRSKALGTILVLSERRNSSVPNQLRSHGYEVLETFTTDHAVAVCVNNPVGVAVLDQDYFIETDGWSVAQSLKAAKPGICVLLGIRARQISKRLPKGVDAVVSGNDPDAVLAKVQRLSPNSAKPVTTHPEMIGAVVRKIDRRWR